MGDLSKNFVLTTFKDIVVQEYGVSSSEESVFEARDNYGDELSDDFMNGIYEYISPPGSEWPYDEIWEDNDLYNRQMDMLVKILNSLSENDLEESGLDVAYYSLARNFIDYAVVRMEGCG